ncbi:phytoene desaturase family protein [Protaetiibacter mangrovi]|uniref:Phytoene desaturase family protein n=1 Tax=Protaetiibacter mangrovi TaxID=2970926 RepID=A0ABT1ZI55_9MICO|nr:phytoene desaturase family protein [Protaetiibacter mangrovi]MCS0500398.1 phytoene desaturase family protein [Protaetiibacter mangrovi]TPX05070.1 phytoene desaturase [Schumannella luteola]
MTAARDVAIVGGGVGGLATAALLAADGHRVTLFEAGEAFGGRAGSWARDGFRFDTGPSWYLMPEVFDHFYRLLGTSAAEQLQLGRLDPGYRVYFEGDATPFDLPAGRERARAALAALDPASWPALERYLDSAETAYRMSVDRFLYGSFDSARPFLDRELVRELPRLRRLLTRSLDDEIRTVTGESRLRRLLGYPAVFLGGTPMGVPSLFHLMSHLDVDDGVLYPRGGFARVVETLVELARAAGAELVSGAEVTRIVVERGRATGVEVRDAAGARQTHPADVVVGAADLHHLETELLPPEARDHTERWWARRDLGFGAVIAMLGVRGHLPELAHHTLLFTDDWDGGFARLRGDELVPGSSLYIGMPSASDPTVAPEGDEALFVLVPSPARGAMGRGGVDGAGDPVIERHVDGVIDQIADWTGAADLAERVVVRRTLTSGDLAAEVRSWGGSMLGPAHTLRQSAMFRAGNRSRRVEGLYFAGSGTIPGIGVPMCLISAELVLKRLRGDRTAAPLEVA